MLRQAGSGCQSRVGTPLANLFSEKCEVSGIIFRAKHSAEKSLDLRHGWWFESKQEVVFMHLHLNERTQHSMHVFSDSRHGIVSVMQVMGDIPVPDSWSWAGISIKSPFLHLTDKKVALHCPSSSPWVQPAALFLFSSAPSLPIICSILSDGPTKALPLDRHPHPPQALPYLTISLSLQCKTVIKLWHSHYCCICWEREELDTGLSVPHTESLYNRYAVMGGVWSDVTRNV